MPFRWIVAILLVAPEIGRAGQWDAVPSDAARLSSAETHSFLEAICPGQVTETGCSTCPKDAWASGGSWELKTITFGHFRSATSEDALVSGFGCASHAEANGGGFLFTRQGAWWRKLRYTPAEIATDCKKVLASDGRDLLLCESSDMHQGVADSFLYLMDVGKDSTKSGRAGSPTTSDESTMAIFFGLDDSLGSCVRLPDGTTVTGEIVSVSLDPPSGHYPVAIRVNALLGKAAIPDSVLARCRPGKKGVPEIRTAPVRFDFRFDGTKILPDKDNPATEQSWAIAPLTSWR